MSATEELLALAVHHHRAGAAAQAEQLYRQILQAEPHHAGALHLLGVLAAQGGRADLAIDLIGQALRISPLSANFHNSLGNALRNQRQLDEAVRSYRQALDLQPDYVTAYENLGAVLQQQRRWEEAVACYRLVLRLQPDAAAAHFELGNALQALERLDEASASYRQALRFAPHHPVVLNNLGNALAKLGQLAEAADSYQQALALQPANAAVYCNLGNVLRDQGKVEEAVSHYRNALRLKPDHALAHNNLGNALIDQGKLEEAEFHCRQALHLQPDFAAAHNNLGIALYGQGRLEDALANSRRAVHLQPDCHEAHNNLGNVLNDQGKAAEAIASYRQALYHRPDYAAAHNNLGNALKDQGNLEEAMRCYRQALYHRPDYALAHNNLGNALKDQGNLEEAMRCYRQALRCQPDFAGAHSNLGTILREQGRLDEAVACLRRAVEIKPAYVAARGELVHCLQHLCLWEDVGELSHRVIEAVTSSGVGETVGALAPFIFFALPIPTTAQQQCLCARQHVEQQFKAAMLAGCRQTWTLPEGPRSPIRLGYLSGDFHAHATAFLIAELFEKHDRTQFEVCGYSYGPDDGSRLRRRLIQAFDRFVDLKDISSQEAVRRIRADGVDILIDLKGYTKDSRTQILALRPAPVQVNYLGYPGTMGAPFMDYILVDDFIVPPDQQAFFTEKLVHLPGCYQVNDSQRAIAAQTPARAACGLPNEGFVFCSFNNSYKITPAMFGVWMRLLQAVPGSVLWLLEGNRFAPANLRREAAARGVTGERLVFAPQRPLPEHLARHRWADLFLDTFPVNAHTTASDALWAGCPVLTLAGETFVARVAGSLLRALGLPELVTTSLEAYETLALQLARDAGRLAALRGRLEANRATSGLFDAGRFARHLEKAFATMWAIHAAGDPPRGFAVSPT